LGNFWLFGGVGYDSTGAQGDLNDLWEYTPTSQKWTWVAGNHLINQGGVYGVQGTGNIANIPGSRANPISWIDTAGNLWLFGGTGWDSTTSFGYLNDLWEYTPTSQKWTWVAGSNLRTQSGTYGIQGTGSTSNIPGARGNPISWIDISGNLWLFGGDGYDSTGTQGYLNDLWEYTPTSQKWTWVAGNHLISQIGTYGTKGTGSTSNIPGARYQSISWIDTSGNFWLFGGYGYDSIGAQGFLGDLWEFTPASLKWTWVAGVDLQGLSGMYGTQGTASTSNIPGARNDAISWIDTSGNFWLFGGYGFDSMGTSGPRNDLWKLTP
jgi:N-acetylneuraminic acid mutarotase